MQLMKSVVAPQTFSREENFAYLLAELELVVGSGQLEWTPASASIARRRLARLADTIKQFATRSSKAR
jgi:hypothetical protein